MLFETPSPRSGTLLNYYCAFVIFIGSINYWGLDMLYWLIFLLCLRENVSNLGVEEGKKKKKKKKRETLRKLDEWSEMKQGIGSHGMGSVEAKDRFGVKKPHFIVEDYLI